MSNSKHVVVIGGGPGGYAAAFLAASHGFRCTLIDKMATPGGVCLHRGCIPSKALLHVAKVLRESREATEMGIRFAKPDIDATKLRLWKESVVTRLTDGLGQQCGKRGVEFIQGEVRFLSSAEIEIRLETGDVNSLKADHFILATGSRPAMIPGIDQRCPLIWNSTDALKLESIPKSLLVVGGGYIGLELGSVYSALGTAVSVVEMTAGLLPGADRDLVRVLSRSIKASFSQLLFDTRVTALDAQDKSVQAHFETADGKSRQQQFDRVLISIGRKPNTENLGLEHTKVRISERGFIQVDKQMRSDDPRIMAIGDVVGDPMLAHKASHEARVAIEVLAGKKSSFEPLAIPAVVFTDPELGWVGLTEGEAAAQDQKVRVARFPWAASGRALSLGRVDGLSKLIVDPDSERILGMGVVGSGAGELIAEGALAIEMGAVVQDLADTIHPHPTLSETVMESAEVFMGHCTHYFTGKKK